MTRKQKRLSVIAGGLAFLGAATGLTFYALGQKASYFYMPADLTTASLQPGQRIRLGGLVEKGTIERGQGTAVAFSVTDNQKQVKVTYTGILPDLFREGQGVITEGTFRRGRRLRRRQRAGQARRELHAQGSGRRPQGQGRVAGEQSDKQVPQAVRPRFGRQAAATSSAMVEIGHFALVLAFALSLVQSMVPLFGARIGDQRLMAVGGPVAVTGFALTALAFAALTTAYATVRFLGRQRLGELAFAEAAALQDHRHLGQSRGLDAALGADPDLLRGARRCVRPQSAGDACAPTCWPCRAGSAPPSCCSSC